MIPKEILMPVVALVVWTMVMWFWMYLTRIPAIIKMRMKLDAHAPRGEQMSTLPASVRWKADNYNHLMEQPTLFYAVVIVLALLGAGSGINLGLAWAYVILRIFHSISQATIANVMLRFVLFSISSLVLIALIINAVCAILA